MIFRYPGGKSRSYVSKWILGNRPGGVKEYREPMVGGGGVFFASPSFEKCWLNDKHEGLMAVYEALRDRPEEFARICREIRPMQPGEPESKFGRKKSKAYNTRLGEEFRRLIEDEATDQALRYLFVNRTCFAGRVNYAIPSRLYYSNPTGWNVVATDKLEQAARCLGGVRLTCGDYEPLFEEPGKGVWIYADPPYMKDTELTPTSQLYEHSFTMEDHERLAETVKGCRHKVAVSYEDHPEVRRLYAGFRIDEAEWAYCGNNVNDQPVRRGPELLILNY